MRTSYTSSSLQWYIVCLVPAGERLTTTLIITLFARECCIVQQTIIKLYCILLREFVWKRESANCFVSTYCNKWNIYLLSRVVLQLWLYNTLSLCAHSPQELPSCCVSQLAARLERVSLHLLHAHASQRIYRSLLQLTRTYCIRSFSSMVLTFFSVCFQEMHLFEEYVY